MGYLCEPWHFARPPRAVKLNPIPYEHRQPFQSHRRPDLLIVLFIVTLLFGAKKLPELASGMGQAVREFTKAKDDPQ